MKMGLDYIYNQAVFLVALHYQTLMQFLKKTHLPDSLNRKIKYRQHKRQNQA